MSAEPSRELTVAVLGAGGTIAPAIDPGPGGVGRGRRAAAAGPRRRARARPSPSEHGLGKCAGASGRRPRGPRRRARAAATCSSTRASYRVNLEAMRACLGAGCHYIDLGGLYWLTGRQLELDSEFERAGLLALLGMGSSPGKTNVMAVRAVRDARREPRELRRDGRRPRPRPAAGGTSFPYALQTLVDELTMRPVVVEDGEPRRDRAARERRRGRLRRADRRGETIYTLHSELRTFPTSFGCREASFRLSLPPPCSSGCASWRPRRPERDRRPPRGPRCPLLRHRVRARGRGFQRGAHGAGARRHRADRALGARGRRRLDRCSRRRSRAPARARPDRGDAARCRPSAASTPTTCSRSSSAAAPRSR